MSDLTRLTTALEQRYRIERQLGAGGMATVYLATDLKHDREVALKVLRPELGAVLGVERFLAEIKITARLDHPHILTLIDSGAEAGYLYYVLPFVRGESLRDKLNRDHQLGLDEAIAITRQVASALDYAHRHGVVHRDIKPENILLLEGEAMLADFGIALAVSEAGGNRLTETGLSLGTPQYMSPEQATGDRLLDARSDVYSLAAVLYEMLAGEPPVTGPSAQAMIAKLMTERPVHLRVVRPAIPEAVDAAVARALDKTPADRFASAGDFARALEDRTVTGSSTVPTVAVAAPRSRRRLWIGVAVALAALAVSGGAWLSTHRRPAAPAPTTAVASYALRDRSQLTFTGTVFVSAVSGDGKQLAFVTHNCGADGCTYAVDLQDVGGSATHRVLDGATAAYGLEWSPDRRNLIFIGTINRHWGFYLVSALGSPPRYLGPSAAMFWAGGDSLLIGPTTAAGGDSVFQVRVTSIDGTVRDSIRVPGPGRSLDALSVSPGGRWIVALVVQGGRGLWQVLDRSGKVADRVVNSCTCAGRITHDALWLTRAGTGAESIVRIDLDPATGKLSDHQDTLLSGNFNNFSVTTDGGTLVIDDGAPDFSLWTIDLPDALKGKFADPHRRFTTSTFVNADLSPDGSRVLLSRRVPNGDPRVSVLPFDGGSETTVNVPGGGARVSWVNAATARVARRVAGGTSVGLLDVRTGAMSHTFTIPDSLAPDAWPVPGGWAWIPNSRDRVHIERAGKAVDIPKPAWFAEFGRLAVDSATGRVVMMGWNAATLDSMGVAVAPLAGGTPEQWAAEPAEFADVQWLDDGNVLFSVRDTPESVVLYRLAGPGRSTRLGRVARPSANTSVSSDLKRMSVVERNYRGDAFSSRVVRVTGAK
ncbi:MAG TPA: protein kinase [Gemmatimonadales bacterium]|nr:protein kinase [Gemmatimonadales bacterium]